MNRLFPLSFGLLAIPIGIASTSCGRFQMKPSGGSDDASPALDGAETADGAAAQADPTVFQFTAAYQKRPIDVIVIRDGASHYDPIGRRVDAAAPVLSARLWNHGDVHVGVFDHVYWDDNPDDDQVPPRNGEPIIGPGGPIAGVLKAETMDAMDFGDALEERIEIAGTRGGQPMPASSLVNALEESKQDGGGMVAGLFRPEAFWAVLYVGATDNPPDALDQQDVMERLTAHPGGFSISALAPEKTGCTFAGLNEARETNPDKRPQRNMEIKMQELTEGVFGSVCAKTYALFMDDFAIYGTGTAYFPVTLPGAVHPETIKIFGLGQVEIKEFRYVPNTTLLEVSTKIEPGEAFEVHAVPLVPIADAVVGTDPGDDVPQAVDEELPPEQQAFVQNVQPALQRNCGGCHAGRPFSVNFGSATMYRDEIARRINLPAGDPQRMPQNGNLPDADRQAILDWTAQ